MNATWALLVLPMLIAEAPTSPASSTISVSGVVVDPSDRGVGGVIVTTDVARLVADTDREGRFRLTLPAGKTSVRVHLEKKGYFAADRQVALPVTGLGILLIPEATRGLRPQLPAAAHAELAKYRQAEVRQIREFVSKRDGQRLLTIDGLPGVDATEVVLTALAGDKSVVWWPCGENDDPLGLAFEIGKAIKEKRLVEFALYGQRDLDARSRERHRHMASVDLMHRLDVVPRVLVLDHFERWLATDARNLRQGNLAEWLALLVTQARNVKVLTISEADPALPTALEALKRRLEVTGLPIDEVAVPYLRDALGVQLPDASLKALAKHYKGHPFALRIVAAQLNRMSRDQRKPFVNELLTTAPWSSVPDRGALAALFDELYSRLSPEERWALELLSLSSRPLAAADLVEINGLLDAPHRRGDVSAGTLQTLSTRFHVVDLHSVGSPAVTHYSLPEIVRGYFGQRLAADDLRRRALGRAYYLWYSRKDLTLAPFDIPLNLSPDRVSQYEELTRHAFAFAELSSGQERKEAIVVGTKSALAMRGAHALEHAQRLMVIEVRRALQLLGDDSSNEAIHLRAGCSLALAEASEAEEAERWYAEADALYAALGNTLGRANVALSRADRLIVAGDLLGARERVRSALTAYRSTGNMLGEANALNLLAEVELRLECAEEVAQNLDQAAVVYERIGGRHGLAVTQLRRGQILQAASDFKGAAQLYSRALEIANVEEFRWLGATTLSALADIHGEVGDVDRADKEYRDALEVFESVEDDLGTTNALFGLAYDRAVRAAQIAAEDARLSERKHALADMQRVRDRYASLDETVGRIRSGLVLASELNDLKRTEEAASEYLTTLGVVARYAGHRNAIFGRCRALRLDTDTAKFDAEVERQVDNLLSTERQAVRRLIEQINTGGAEPAPSACALSN